MARKQLVKILDLVEIQGLQGRQAVLGAVVKVLRACVSF